MGRDTSDRYKKPIRPRCAVCNEPWKAHTEDDECPEYTMDLRGLMDYRPHPTKRYKPKEG